VEKDKPTSIEYLEDMLAQMQDDLDDISSSVSGLESKINHAEHELQRMKEKEDSH
jgi:prefoldin subunit 5